MFLKRQSGKQSKQNHCYRTAETGARYAKMFDFVPADLSQRWPRSKLFADEDLSGDRP
jgi:hypothetical protein